MADLADQIFNFRNLQRQRDQDRVTNAYNRDQLAAQTEKWRGESFAQQNDMEFLAQQGLMKIAQGIEPPPNEFAAAQVYNASKRNYTVDPSTGYLMSEPSIFENMGVSQQGKVPLKQMMSPKGVGVSFGGEQPQGTVNMSQLVQEMQRGAPTEQQLSDVNVPMSGLAPAPQNPLTPSQFPAIGQGMDTNVGLNPKQEAKVFETKLDIEKAAKTKRNELKITADQEYANKSVQRTAAEKGLREYAANLNSLRQRGLVPSEDQGVVKNAALRFLGTPQQQDSSGRLQGFSGQGVGAYLGAEGTTERESMQNMVLPLAKLILQAKGLSTGSKEFDTPMEQQIAAKLLGGSKFNYETTIRAVNNELEALGVEPIPVVSRQDSDSADLERLRNKYRR